MDPPPPDDYDPHLVDEQAYDCDDDSDDSDEGCDHEGQPKPTQGRPERPGCSPTPESPDFTHENSMYQRFIDFCLSLIVPTRNASPEELRRNLISLTVAVTGIYAALGIAYGWGESIGLSGFAKADTVIALQKEATDVRVTLYAVAIRDLHRSKCNAVNYEDELTLSNQLQEMQVKYQKTVGIPYILPACPSRRL
jgi:hypothetical protein